MLKDAKVAGQKGAPSGTLSDREDGYPWLFKNPNFREQKQTPPSRTPKRSNGIKDLQTITRARGGSFGAAEVRRMDGEHFGGGQSGSK